MYGKIFSAFSDFSSNQTSAGLIEHFDAYIRYTKVLYEYRYRIHWFYAGIYDILYIYFNYIIYTVLADFMSETHLQVYKSVFRCTLVKRSWDSQLFRYHLVLAIILGFSNTFYWLLSKSEISNAAYASLIIQISFKSHFSFFILSVLCVFYTWFVGLLTTMNR